MLSAELLVVILGINLLALLLLDLLSNLVDLRNEVHVVSHDLEVVRFMDLTLDLKSFLKRVH